MIVDRILADFVVTLHALFVGFVMAGLPFALAGRFLQWEWTRNFWLRSAHLAAILFVVILTWLDQPCPLTVWENALREQAGQARYPGDFIGFWVHELLFFAFPQWVFTTIYSLFGLAVAATLWIAPPRSPTHKPAAM